jgi:asparagine synthase (glutamine-hydrolysing)
VNAVAAAATRSAMDEPYRLTGLELATAAVLGADPALTALSVDGAQPNLRDAIEARLLDALRRPPCVVNFSGGRDSSSLLAVAAKVAAQHGLEPPIASTNRFRDAPEADERAWQEQVIAHVGVTEWVRHDFDDELDLLGPYARRVLEQFGVVHPVNAFFALPAVELAAGGSLVTGVGGDELFGVAPSDRFAWVLDRRFRPHARDLLVAARHATPFRVRAIALAHRAPRLAWLRAPAQRELNRRYGEELASEHVWWGQQVRDTLWRARTRSMRNRTGRALAATRNAMLVTPFAEEGVLRAAAAQYPRCAWRSREEAMTSLFADVVPLAVLRRETKASFFAPFVHRHSRAFIAGWAGDGINGEIVDRDGLRAEWSEPQVDGRTFGLLQQAWLDTRGGARRMDGT